jgi:CRP-like cAMP-binding protein
MNTFTYNSKGEQLAVEEICVGHLVGEFGLINNTERHGSLTALVDCDLLILSKVNFEKIVLNEPYLAFSLSRICMVNVTCILVSDSFKRHE